MENYDNTGKLITAIKNSVFCTGLNTQVSNYSAAEQSYEENEKTFAHLKKSFVKTRKNFVELKNFQLTLGVELLEATGEINSNVTSYTDKNKALGDALTTALNSITAAKASFGDLRDSASKLGSAVRDISNRGQYSLITGEKNEDDEEKNKQVSEKKLAEYKEAKKLLDELIKKPANLFQDIETVLNATNDVLGIQTFSNLNAFAQEFNQISANVTDFGSNLNNQMTSLSTEMDGVRGNLTGSINDLSKSAYSVYRNKVDMDSASEMKNLLYKNEGKEENSGRKGSDKLINDRKSAINSICEAVTGIYGSESRSENSQAQSKDNKNKK